MIPTETGLLAHLLENFSKDHSRTELKRLLKFSLVRVNGTAQTRHDFPLKKNDRVEILSAPPGGREAVGALTERPVIGLVYEDDSLLVVNKPPRLLTVATEKVKERTLYYRLNEYLKARRQRIFIVHRLDREVSGLIVFTKTEEAKHKLQDSWETAEKKYAAVVEGVPRPSEGEWRSALSQTKALRVYSTDRPENSKLAITRYKVLKNNRRCSLLEVTIPTGRKHQIRVHSSEAGHPILGDFKYGSQGDPLRRIALHAESLEFTHPVTGKRLKFKTGLPEGFLSLAC